MQIPKQDLVILGSGRSNSWRGSLKTHVEEAHMQMDTYLGTQQNTTIQPSGSLVPIFFFNSNTTKDGHQIAIIATTQIRKYKPTC